MVPVMWKLPTKPLFPTAHLILGGRDYVHRNKRERRCIAEPPLGASFVSIDKILIDRDWTNQYVDDPGTWSRLGIGTNLMQICKGKTPLHQPTYFIEKTSYFVLLESLSHWIFIYNPSKILSEFHLKSLTPSPWIPSNIPQESDEIPLKWQQIQWNP